jgi:hypothetical protein
MTTQSFNIRLIEKQTTWVLTLWGLLVYIIGYAQLYASVPRRFFGLTIVAIVTLSILLYFKNRSFKFFADSIPLRYLSLSQAWRIFAGLVFCAHFNELPYSFAHEAAYGDIASGLIGVFVFLMFQNRTGYWIVNILGLLDLVIVVSTGMYFVFISDVKMVLMTEAPMILIPFLGVPIAVVSHIVSLSRLIRGE